MPTIITKPCSKCGGEFDQEAFFRKDTSKDRRSAGALAEQYRAVCIGCELSERLICWKQYKKHREGIRGNVTYGLPLFN